jgi:hypothetical protein
MRAICALLISLFWVALGQSQPTMTAQQHEHPVPEKS